MINIQKNKTVFDNTADTQENTIVITTLDEAKALFVSQAKKIASNASIKAMKKDGFTFAVDIHEWIKNGQPSGKFYANIIVSYDGQRFAKRYQQAPLGSWNSEDGFVFLNFEYKTLSVIYALVKINFGKLNAAHYFPELANYKRNYSEDAIAI